MNIRQLRRTDRLEWGRLWEGYLAYYETSRPQAHFDAYFERLLAAFSNVLTNARGAGELSDAANVDDLAAFFTMALIGVAASAKGKADPDWIHASCRVTISALDPYRLT